MQLLSTTSKLESINSRRHQHGAMSSVRAIMISERALLVALIIFFSTLAGECWGAQYSIKPRVRKEWRTLNKEEREAVAEAVWIMKNTTTAEGKAKYGDRFISHDDLTVMHACSVVDPRCDQAHQGPHFATFHRAFVLAWENSLLSVLDVVNPGSSVNAMPYWDHTLDSNTGKYRNDPDKYIFTDNYFGDFMGDPNNEYVVTNGLFAYFPVAEWTPEKYGKDSPLNVRCTREEWYVGTQASICDECCGKDDSCSCDRGGTFRRFLRGNDDLLRRQDRCVPYMTRNTWESPAINGLHDIQGSQEDYDTCVDPANIKTWMEWQRCVEFSQASCLVLVALGSSCEDALPTIEREIQVTDVLSFIRKMMFRVQIPILCKACTFEGEVTNVVRGKSNPIVQHTLSHLMTGGDFGDLLTSPNDPALFYGYHANSDRSNMQWMINTQDQLEANWWGYPRGDMDLADGQLFKLAGPFPVYPALGCLLQPEVFREYTLFGSTWLPGTRLDDVVNSGFPIDNLFDTPPANGWGYTHKEILYHTSPQRTPYTYDSLAHYYYDESDPTQVNPGDPVKVNLSPPRTTEPPFQQVDGLNIFTANPPDGNR